MCCLSWLWDVDLLFTFARVLGGTWELQSVHTGAVVDLEKAYNGVPRGTLWRALRNHGGDRPALQLSPQV